MTALHTREQDIKNQPGIREEYNMSKRPLLDNKTHIENQIKDQFKLILRLSVAFVVWVLIIVIYTLAFI